MTNKPRKPPIPEMETFVALVESQEIEKVKAAIKLKYGFECTSRYAADLINFVETFVEMMLEGDTSEPE